MTADRGIPWVGYRSSISMLDHCCDLLIGSSANHEQMVEKERSKVAGRALESEARCSGSSAARGRRRPNILEDRNIVGSVVGGKEIQPSIHVVEEIPGRDRNGQAT